MGAPYSTGSDDGSGSCAGGQCNTHLQHLSYSIAPSSTRLACCPRSDDPEMVNKNGLWEVPKPPPYVDLETDMDR